MFEEGDSLWLDAKVTPNNRQMKNNINLILVKLDSKTLSSCTVETPVSSTLVKLASCSVDTNQSVQDGHFTAPSDGVYKVVYNGLMKVEGAGKVHANILKKTVEGKFKTQVAGFTKMSSQNHNDLYGALLASSECMTAYVSMMTGESLHLGMGRDKTVNNIAAVKAGVSQAVHFSVEKIS